MKSILLSITMLLSGSLTLNAMETRQHAGESASGLTGLRTKAKNLKTLALAERIKQGDELIKEIQKQEQVSIGNSSVLISQFAELRISVQEQLYMDNEEMMYKAPINELSQSTVVDNDQSRYDDAALILIGFSKSSKDQKE